MAIVHHYDARVNTTYVYESKGYYDREAHKTKTHRKLIGKLDENGNLVPTGKVGSPPKKVIASTADDVDNVIDYKTLYESYLKESKLKEERIDSLKAELAQERKTRRSCESTLRKMLEIGGAYRSVHEEAEA